MCLTKMSCISLLKDIYMLHCPKTTLCPANCPVQHLCSPSDRLLRFSSCLFKSPTPSRKAQSALIGRLSQARADTHFLQYESFKQTNKATIRRRRWGRYPDWPGLQPVNHKLALTCSIFYFTLNGSEMH